MLFYNERLEPDSFLSVMVIQRPVTGDAGSGSRWLGYSQGEKTEQNKVSLGQTPRILALP